jgi:HPt (histidine-containing phosphotransfer) domain-containing protein
VSGYPPINRAKLAAIKAELGEHLPRILSYFAEDGVKSLDEVEEAVRIRDAVGLVRPAHTLKGEALQFGADALGYTAEKVEKAARLGVENHSFPKDIIDDAMRLRTLFQEAIALLQRETAPVAPPPMALRRPTGGFGRKVG